MESTMMPSNYANSDDILYGAHYATLISNKVTYENNVGQFVLEYVTPNMKGSGFEKTIPKASTSNVVNKDNLGTSKITTSNYISITIPKHFFYITKIDIVTNRKNHTCAKCGFDATYTCAPTNVIHRKEYTKGQVFVVVNIGGDVDSPCIVGVVEK